jgi:hypothetical protein
MYNFIDACSKGFALLEEIDDYIDSWHESDTDLTIYEFLGMKKKEYALYVEDESYLAIIVTAHRNNEDINTIIENQISIAARSDNHAKSQRLEKWLKDEGLWE